jgi:hypothetical protein
LDDFQQRKNERFWRCPHTGAEGVRIAHRSQSMSGLKSTTIVDGPANTKRLEMSDTCRRSHDHTRSGDVSPPTKFEILTMKRNG